MGEQQPGGLGAHRAAPDQPDPYPVLRHRCLPNAAVRRGRAQDTGAAGVRGAPVRPSTPGSADVEREQVVLGLAPHDHRRDAVPHGHDGRARHEVVVGRHRPAVRPGRGHGEQVAGGDVGGQVDVVHHDVAALAVLADDAGQDGPVAARPRDERRGVPGAVERRPNVVAHAAVDGDVRAYQALVDHDGLDRADRVERERGGPDDRPAGLDRDAWHGRAQARAGGVDDAGDVLGHAVRLERDVAGEVGDAEPAAEVHLGQQVPGERGQLRAQLQHGACRDLEPGGVEDLGADVGVHADEVQRRARQDRAQRSHRLTAGDREAELLVLVGRRDVLVPARVDARRDPDHHRRAHARRRRGVGDPVHLAEGVDDDAPDAGRERPRDLGVGLVVAVQADVRPGHARAQGDGQLATRRGVDAQALLVRPAGDSGAQERLARVVHVDVGADPGEGPREALAEGPRPRPEVGLVQHVGRGAVLGGQGAQVDPGDPHGAVGASGGAGRPQVRRQAHMRSGALTPSRRSPLASTVRVASFSHRRVRWASVTGSSPSGTTRRCWSYHLWYVPASSSR